MPCANYKYKKAGARCTAVARKRHAGTRAAYSTSSSRTTTTQDAAQTVERLEELSALGQDLIATAVRAGPRAAFRTAQAIEAAISVGTELSAEVGTRAAQSPAAAADAAAAFALLPSPPNVLRRLCEKLGATYIKLGQFVASAPTIFPPEYVEEFQKCLDQAPPVPFEEVRRIVEQETGAPLTTTFTQFDETPIASASVAVVHRAVLRSSGREVAVKVLRPGIGDTLSVDLDFITSAARILQFLQPELKRLSLADIAADIQTSMLEEVDLRKELVNLKAFRAYVEASGVIGVTAPVPFEQYCSERVMVMEYLRGVPLTDLDAIRDITASVRGSNTSARDPEEVLINALNAWLGSVFLAESFHADVHAGNLLALPNGDVAFIDFGIVGRVAPTTWGALRDLFSSMGAKVSTADPSRPSTAIDYEAMAMSLVAIGATDDKVAASVDISAFARDLQELFSSIDDLEPSVTVVRDSAGASTAAAASLSVDEAALNRAVGNLASTGDKYGLKFPREFGLLVKQALYFDRYTRILAPGLEVGADPRINLADR
ncbi:protein kinase domain-containing protein [Pseudoscourfieldia marina]